MGGVDGRDGLDGKPGRPNRRALVLAPFRALRYASRAGDLAQLTAPPYDVVDESSETDLEHRSPYNVVHLVLPRGPIEGAHSRYERAATQLAEWRAAGVLACDGTPALYVYEQCDEQARWPRQIGLIGAVALRRPEERVVLPHEAVLPGPVADRLLLAATTRANLEPIFLIYPGGDGAATRAADGTAMTEPLAEARTDDGVRHRLWRIDDRALLAEIADDLAPRTAVIADGHHRYAAALQYQEQQRSAGAGEGPWDYGLALLVDIDRHPPRVQPIHRVLPGLALAAAVEAAKRGFTVEPLPFTDPGELTTALADAGASTPAFVLASNGRAALLRDPDLAVAERYAPADASPAWRRLDVSVAHHYLLHALLGRGPGVPIDYRYDVPSALAAADATSGVALLLNPTPVESVLAVASAGELLPRKATSFTPKPRSGFVLRSWWDAASGSDSAARGSAWSAGSTPAPGDASAREDASSPASESASRATANASTS